MVFTLIGMPGCGKSCMGKAVSSKLKIRNIDSDSMIEKTEGKKLFQVLEDRGLDGFKALEEEVLSSFSEDNCILSTGGSAVYSEKAMLHLKSLGKVIYLKVSLDVLKKRLGDYSKRGIALRPGQTLDDLYEERTKLYEKYADITVNCSGNAFPRYHSELISHIQKYLAEPSVKP